MTRVWIEEHQSLYERTRQLLCDAGLSEELADELARERALGAALASRETTQPRDPTQPAEDA